MSKNKPVDAQWEPVKGKPTFLDLLSECARNTCAYAAVNLILFYWQQNGLLAPSAATPAMWVCALLTGVSLGKAIAKSV